MRVILEDGCLLLMPLVTGWAVDGLMDNQTMGVVPLGLLCIALMAVGAGRRFYDTRAYSARTNGCSVSVFTSGS